MSIVKRTYDIDTDSGRVEILERLRVLQNSDIRNFIRLCRDIYEKGYDIEWDNVTDKPLLIYRKAVPYMPDLENPLPFDD